MPSTYVFYHEDADGHCAAAVFKYSCDQNEELDLRSINYGYDSNKMFGDLETGARLVFLDFCPTEEDLKALHDKGISYCSCCPPQVLLCGLRITDIDRYRH